jgi:glycosyltransferase involved in cell wall biosynthesis
MPRLIFVNRFFYPDHSATSQILSDLAFHLAATGRDVHVITSTQIYDDPKATLTRRQLINGVEVHRVSSTHYGRAALAGRAVDYLSFYRSVRRAIFEIARPGDIVVAKTDPPLLSVVALGVVGRRGAHLVNWLQDIYPETAVELKVPFFRGPVAASLAALRNRSLFHAMATVAVGEGMGHRVIAFGAPASRVHIIPNWCDDQNIEPIAPGNNPLRKAWGLDDKFVFGYSGNLGRAHEFDTVLAAAERLRDETRLVFLMIGGGKRLEELSKAVGQRSLDASFRFMPYQERSKLSQSLGVADAHWLSLSPKLEGLIVPSKFYGIAAAGRPIVVIADKGGEFAPLVEQYDCGVAVAPGDADALVDVLRRFLREPETVAGMGLRARRMLGAGFTQQQGFTRWQDLFDQLLRCHPTIAERP